MELPFLLLLYPRIYCFYLSLDFSNVALFHTVTTLLEATVLRARAPDRLTFISPMCIPRATFLLKSLHCILFHCLIEDKLLSSAYKAKEFGSWLLFSAYPVSLFLAHSLPTSEYKMSFLS